MDFPFSCSKCHAPNAQPYNDEGLYIYQCACGEKNSHTIRKERFEILFDFGALAFLDGYYREAVANFAAAFERFLEFFVRTIWREQRLAPELAERTWKLMANQSERQLGAFTALYLTCFREPPDFLRPSALRVEFRNEVIHKGKIPSREETEQYAGVLYDFIRSQLIRLASVAPASVGMSMEEHAAAHSDWAKRNGYSFSCYCFDGLFGLSRFLPTALEMEEERGRAYPADRKHFIDSLSTKLDFSGTLAARRLFLEACFVRSAAGVSTSRNNPA